MNSTFVIVFIGRLAQIVLSLLSVRIYTTCLSYAEVGNLYIINAIYVFFGLCLINPVGMYINRRLHKWTDEKTIVSYFFIFNIYLLMLSLLSVMVVYVTNVYFDVGIGVDIKLLLTYIMLSIYFGTWNQTIIPSLNMLDYRKSFVLFTIITLSMGLVLSVVMVNAISSSAVLWLYGQLIAQAIMALIGFAYFKLVTNARYDGTFVKQIINWPNLYCLLKFVFPLTVTTFFMWMQGQSYRMIIEKYIGLEFLGMIGLGMGIAASIAAAVESLVQQIYYPIFYSEINTSNPLARTLAWDKMARVTIPLYLSVTLLVSCLAPYLVKILVSEKFSQTFIYVIYGAWIEFFRMTTNILSGVAHSEMQTKSLIKAYLLGGLIASVGVYSGSLFEDYQQVIPAILVFSGLLTVAIMYVDMKKLMQIHIDIGSILSAVTTSLPFAIAMIFYYKATSMLCSLIITFIFGSYFLIVQYYKFKTQDNG